MDSESKERNDKIISVLAGAYAGADTALEFRGPFQLLVATALAAQSTDAQVNKATKALFDRYPDALSMSRASAEDLIPYIKTIGLFRNKAKNLAGMARALVENFSGEVPRTREGLMTLPGVGRKTANVVLSNAFGVAAMAVDTHVFRVARRMGLAAGKTPREVEDELCALIPEKDWARAHHWLIWHGRRVCSARNPDCEACQAGGICPRLGLD